MKYYISLAIITTLICILFVAKRHTLSNDFVLNEPYNIEYKVNSTYGIFILSEAGCIACNREYFNFILNKAVNKKNILIYSTASGMRLDISPFLSDTIDNLIDKKEDLLNRLNLEAGSYFIEINRNRVDTIIPIKAKDIEQSLHFIGSLSYFK